MTNIDGTRPFPNRFLESVSKKPLVIMAQTNRTAGDKHHQRFHVIAAQPAAQA
jgi:hypothetical protein